MIAVPAVQLPKGGGQAGKGCPRGGGQSAIAQPGGGHPAGAPARFYAFLARPDAVASDAVITSIISVYDRDTSIYRSCLVTFCGYETRADLLLLDIINFEVILGMDWLSLYHSILDCHAKTITLAMPELPRLEWRGFSIISSSRVKLSGSVNRVENNNLENYRENGVAVTIIGTPPQNPDNAPGPIPTDMGTTAGFRSAAKPPEDPQH
uniref:Uncharacterized protein LOC104246683 n=1 Tax=Nicotiana sylvestris TaxID=4096 RepID=A0A1U7YPT8_NICSY